MFLLRIRHPATIESSMKPIGIRWPCATQRKRHYALFYSKGRGIIAVGQIVTDTPTEVADEKYHSIRMIVPEKFNGDVKALPALSPNQIKTILKRNFYWASTIKTPFLTGAQVEMLIRELKKKHV